MFSFLAINRTYVFIQGRFLLLIVDFAGLLLKDPICLVLIFWLENAGIAIYFAVLMDPQMVLLMDQFSML